MMVGVGHDNSHGSTSFIIRVKWFISFKPLRLMLNTNQGKPSRFYGWTKKTDMSTGDLETFANLRELIFIIHQHSVYTR